MRKIVFRRIGIAFAALGPILITFILLLLPFIEGELLWLPFFVEDSKMRGDLIVAAIRKYQQDTGSLPNNLDDLYPKYMLLIPAPVAGTRKWDYRVFHDEKRFQLCFRGSNLFPVCYYDSASPTSGWVENH